jgi:hypothetical protein
MFIPAAVLNLHNVLAQHFQPSGPYPLLKEDTVQPGKSFYQW